MNRKEVSELLQMTNDELSEYANSLDTHDFVNYYEEQARYIISESTYNNLSKTELANLVSECKRINKVFRDKYKYKLLELEDPKQYINSLDKFGLDFTYSTAWSLYRENESNIVPLGEYNELVRIRADNNKLSYLAKLIFARSKQLEKQNFLVSMHVIMY